MTVRKAHIRITLALIAPLIAGLFANPVGADTEEELEAAKERYQRILGEANAATAAYEAAYADYIRTADAVEETRAAIAYAESRIGRFDRRLAERARKAYQDGPSGSLELLLSSRSVTEFSDRMVFLDHLAQADADLVGRVAVLGEELRRRRSDLGKLLERQAGALAEAERNKGIIYDKLSEAQAEKEKFERQLAAERRTAQFANLAGTTVIPGAALQACPVPGSSFVDTFGAPRSGGRSHQGVDMMAPSGTPVYAAQSGTVQHSSSSLGGTQAYVYADNGDYTFYAHLSGYSGAGSGSHVSAGTHIGYVGDTGNASGTPHLHFEYHPGGGGAVNPYPYVKAVCG